MSPSHSEKQRRFMGAELNRERSGQETKTGMSESQLEDFAKKPIIKEDINLELDKDNPQVGVQMQDTKQHEMLNKSKTKEFNDFMKRNTCSKEDEEKDKEENENEGIQNCEMKKGGPGSGRKKGDTYSEYGGGKYRDKQLGNPEDWGKPDKHGVRTFKDGKTWTNRTQKSSETDFSIEFLEKKIKELDDTEELTKGKVYIQPGQKVPEGKNLKTGSKGAQYYETSSDPHIGLPSDNPKEPGSHTLHDSYYDSPTGPNPKGKTAHDVAKEIGAKFNRKVNSLTTEYVHPKYGIFRVTDDGWGTKLRHIGEGKSTDMKKSITDSPIQQAFNNYMNSFSGQESKDECIAFVNTSSPIVKITSMWDKQTNEEYPDSSGISDKNLQEGAKKENIEKQPYDYTKTVYENPELDKEKDKDEEEMELEKGGPGSGPKYGKAGVPKSKTAPALKEWEKHFSSTSSFTTPNSKGEYGKGNDEVSKSEKLDAFNDYVQKEMPTPPRSGLVFNRQSHRWERQEAPRITSKDFKEPSEEAKAAYTQAHLQYESASRRSGQAYNKFLKDPNKGKNYIDDPKNPSGDKIANPIVEELHKREKEEKLARENMYSVADKYGLFRTPGHVTSQPGTYDAKGKLVK